jgi:uncharacterized membrane protein YuzA (DUF378 family)
LTKAENGDMVACTNSLQEVDSMKRLDLLAVTLVLVGGLNWGLVGLAKFDLVAWIFGLDFGQTNAATRVVYSLVGLGAVYGIGALAARRRSPVGHAATAGAR